MVAQRLLYVGPTSRDAWVLLDESRAYLTDRRLHVLDALVDVDLSEARPPHRLHTAHLVVAENVRERHGVGRTVAEIH